jgi:hypothetical protein
MYRQGDVLVVAIDESRLPAELVPAPRDRSARSARSGSFRLAETARSPGVF